MSKAIIALEDGTIFQGKKFAGSGEAFGEIVFNTSMTGYQEILTDPSYCGQIVTMTYPLIGNYGVNDEDIESRSIFASGLIVSEYSRIYNNWRAKKSLAEYLEEYNKIGIHEIDTRAITLHIRDKGAMKCVISTENDNVDELIQKAKSSTGLNGIDLASTVSTDKSYKWASTHDQKKYNVAVIDCGIKLNQLRILQKIRCDITVFPSSTKIEEILKINPQGIFISNGPGDPAGANKITELVKDLILTKIPLLVFVLDIKCLA